MLDGAVKPHSFTRECKAAVHLWFLGGHFLWWQDHKSMCKQMNGVPFQQKAGTEGIEREAAPWHWTSCSFCIQKENLKAARIKDPPEPQKQVCELKEVQKIRYTIERHWNKKTAAGIPSWLPILPIYTSQPPKPPGTMKSAEASPEVQCNMAEGQCLSIKTNQSLPDAQRLQNFLIRV